MKRVGILGSAFNPPHRGHEQLARKAQDFLHLDEVLFVPTVIAPHKPIQEIWGYSVRVLLTCIAFSLETPHEISRRLDTLSHLTPEKRARIADAYHSHYAPSPGWKLWEGEKDRPGPSYTVDTLRLYHSLFPNHEVFLLIGQDQATVFDTWREYTTIFDLATVCVATRPDSPPLPSMPFVLLPPFEEAISSSAIREAWLTGQPIETGNPVVEALLRALRQPINRA